MAATSVNISEPGMDVRIDIFRWSTDQERSQLVTAERLSPDQPISRKPAKISWRYLPVGSAGASVITIVDNVSPRFRSFSLRRSTAPNEIDLT